MSPFAAPLILAGFAYFGVNSDTPDHLDTRLLKWADLLTDPRAAGAGTNTSAAVHAGGSEGHRVRMEDAYLALQAYPYVPVQSCA